MSSPEPATYLPSHLPLHEALLLAVLAAPGSTVPRRRSRELEYALAAAVLLELERARRISVLWDQVLVVDASAAADAVSDRWLERLILSERARRVQAWLGVATDGTLSAVRDQMLMAGRLVQVRRSRFGLFPTVDHEPADRRAAARIAALVEEADRAGGSPFADVGALAVLLRAARLSPRRALAKEVCAPSPLDIVAQALSQEVAAASVPLAFGG
ncbi:GPP34 family phosphoprotein [Streptomyces sp. NPDC001820]|uniref:GPP34 family phosphoprotein n=1 Tax=Streptomyces sp. NPDC001820 TaxID=3364613 RepID=UPI0036BD320C